MRYVFYTVCLAVLLYGVSKITAPDSQRYVRASPLTAQSMEQ